MEKTTISPKLRARNIDREAKSRLRARRKMRLIRAGLTENDIKELEKNEHIRTILCLSYGTHTVQNGTKKRKKDKKEIEVPNILHGTAAIVFTLKQHNIDVLTSGKQYVYVKTTDDKVDEISKIMSPMGRIYVQEWHPIVTSNPVKHKTKKKSAPTMTKAEVKAYYAALRKGGVSKRIKKYNPTLADKITNLIKKKDKQVTSFEKKAAKKAAKKAKIIATNLKVAERNAKKAEINAKKPQKSKKPVETKLKMAA